MRSAYERQCDDLQRMLGISGNHPPELLDVGCGIGVFLSIAREKGFKITGLESSENAARSLRNIGATQANSFAALPDDHFDVVRLSHVLEHIPEPNGFLDECIRVLKPGGILTVIVPSGEPWILRLLNLVRSRRSGPRAKFTGGIYPHMHVLGFSTKSMARLMQSHRLDTVSLKSVSMGSGTYYPWFYDGLLSRNQPGRYLRSKAAFMLLFYFIGNPIGRGEWLAGHFRKPPTPSSSAVSRA